MFYVDKDLQIKKVREKSFSKRFNVVKINKILIPMVKVYYGMIVKNGNNTYILLKNKGGALPSFSIGDDFFFFKGKKLVSIKLKIVRQEKEGCVVVNLR